MSTSTVIVTPSVLLREGIASLLQGTRYQVVASAATAVELSSARYPSERQTLAILGIDLQNGNPDKVTESVRLLRSLLPDAKVVLVGAEFTDPAAGSQSDDPDRSRVDASISFSQRFLALSPDDACIFNIGSHDALLRVLDTIEHGVVANAPNGRGRDAA
jgi:hypothetical protein